MSSEWIAMWGDMRAVIWNSYVERLSSSVQHIFTASTIAT